ncbi:DUF1641 domain-containing protein [Saccharolobus solfataricus]|uniref:DUF1641 domain-containing protein n=3 Tax=Saccharolobus solfataricus TaxID=2287 RepID=Q97WG2_SACS2|nr:DUF1641 domain-containing protein [Saccharolobus solfataricus]AAK42425.1 Hypothetical protein SSO2259 [Saccharolobus solfataricus P2]AKA72525.1 DUF1641 domain-containing protein [Saccharolobus solfataricus]AKA75224.1 DUF1641 domain-containing protein [Saccharolobus solfataricus]AKA77917.1 DUF1641 domain-containing protein [Saccharolobus solfataricus]AZF67035.1 DUF1641 domain-containing protein [Saccharolobus solfataricus]
MTNGEFYALDNLLKDEKLNSLNKILDVINTTDRLGILDVIKGILEDENTIGKIIGSLTSDDVLELLVNWDKVIKTTKLFINEDNIYNIQFLINLIDKVRSKGILDPIIGLLEDEESLGKIINALINDFTLNLINHWEEIINDLSRIDLTNFKYYTLLVSATGEALKTENVKPITSIWEIYKLLKDPDIQRGLGVAASVLKRIGKLYVPDKGLAFEVEKKL